MSQDEGLQIPPGSQATQRGLMQIESNCERMNDKKAAEYLGLSVGTLRRRRLLRKPPKYYKVGGRVVYSRGDLDVFLEACAVRVPAAAE